MKERKRLDLNGLLPDWGEITPILWGYRGSVAHGTYVNPGHPMGTDDLDVFLVVSHPLEFYASLEGLSGKERHWDKITDEGVDIKVYDIQKLVALLEKGNPNVHNWLWTEEQDRKILHPAGGDLIQRRSYFLSKKILRAILGYASNQFDRMKNEPTKGAFLGAKRKKMIQEFGYNVKNASHCIRLLLSGIHLANNHEIVVKMDKLNRELLIRIKKGEVSYDEIVELYESLLKAFKAEVGGSNLQEVVPRSVSNSTLLNAIKKVR